MKRKLRVLKAKGGADAAKDDFKTPSSMSAVTKGNPFSAGNQGATNTSSSINNTNNNTTNNATNNTIQKSRNIPIVGPVTLGINILQNLTKQKTAKHPFSANTKKQTVPKPPPNLGGGGGGGNQMITPIQATKPIDPLLIKPKDNFFNFVAYKVGGLSGGVSYGPPPKRGPNPQVPPVKMKRGGYKK